MHQVLGEVDTEVAPDGTGGRLAAVRGPHHRAHHLEGVLRTFDGHRDDRPARHEPHQALVERLADVLAGRVDAMDVLFPGGDAAGVSRVYSESPGAGAINGLLADAVREA